MSLFDWIKRGCCVGMTGLGLTRHHRLGQVVVRNGAALLKQDFLYTICTLRIICQARLQECRVILTQEVYQIIVSRSNEIY